MRKWIYYCGSWASLIGCLLVASGLESYTGWAMAGCFVGALVLLALAVVLAGLGNCAEQEEDEKPRKERQRLKDGQIPRECGVQPEAATDQKRILYTLQLRGAGHQQGCGKGHGRGQSPGRARGLYLQGLQRGGAEVSRPENLTPDEAEIWQRMELHGEELVRDMGAALMQADKLPEWMQEAAVNMLCDKLADARALAASWMNDHGEP